MCATIRGASTRRMGNGSRRASITTVGDNMDKWLVIGILVWLSPVLLFLPVAAIRYLVRIGVIVVNRSAVAPTGKREPT
jgi:hypothetical protein